MCAYAPWEGYRVSFSGTAGRIELTNHESSYINAAKGDLNEGKTNSELLVLMPHFKAPEIIPVEKGVGGHGGGDVKLLDALYLDNLPEDPLGHAADHLDGARSILTGIAANESMATGQAVDIKDLIEI